MKIKSHKTNRSLGVNLLLAGLLALALPMLAQVTSTNTVETNAIDARLFVVGTNLRGSAVVIHPTNKWSFPLLTRIPGDTNRALGKGRFHTNAWVSTDAAGKVATNSVATNSTP